MTELEKEIEQHLTKWFDGLGIETHQIKNSVRELAKISTAHTAQRVLETENNARHILHSILSDDIDGELDHSDIEAKFVAQLKSKESEKA